MARTAIAALVLLIVLGVLSVGWTQPTSEVQVQPAQWAMFEGDYLFSTADDAGVRENVLGATGTFLYNTATGTDYIVGSADCGGTVNTCIVPLPF